MVPKKKRLEKILTPALQDPVFQEVLNLVKLNSTGKIWIIGGFVYRNLAALYGGAIYNYDIDFIVEGKNDTLKEVPHWRIERNSYGNPNYVSNTHKMSFTDIRKAIRVLGMPSPTIMDFEGKPELRHQLLSRSDRTLHLWHFPDPNGGGHARTSP